MDLLRDALQSLMNTEPCSDVENRAESIDDSLRDTATNLLSIGASAPLLLEVTRLRSLLERLVQTAPGGNSHVSLTPAIDCGRELLRILASADMLRLAAKLAELEEQTRQLRDVLLAGERKAEDGRSVAFDTLVERSISQLRAYSESRRIEIRYHNRAPKLAVVVQQTDVQRALTSILANAIKYSYTLRGEQRAWLVIAIDSGPQEVWVKVESWGVPIAREEIERGTIFLPGGRGTHAIESGRLGSGIGLWDARRVAVRHGGDVEIKSRPTSQKAYVTTATLSLPLVPAKNSTPKAKPINSGQERNGSLERQDSEWVVRFEGDDRLARIENSLAWATDIAEGTRVLTYVSHQSKRTGIMVRIIRLLD